MIACKARSQPAKAGPVEVFGHRRQSGAVRCQIAQRDFAAVRLADRAGRQQLSHRLVQMHLPVHHQLRQQQAREGLSDRPDLIDGIRMRRPVCQHAPLAMLHHAHHDSHAAWKFARQVALQQRFDARRPDRRQGREVSECRHRHRPVGLRTQRQRTHQAGGRMQADHRHTERRGGRCHLGQKQRTRTYRQGRQHQNVAAIRKRAVPTEHGEQSDNQHGRRDQKMLGAPGRELLHLGLHVAGADNHGWARQKEDAHKD